MLQQAPMKQAISQAEPLKDYTIAELADLLSDIAERKITYSQIRSFILRHNRAFPESKIVPFQRTLTGRKIFIKGYDAAIIRDGILHPERTEHPAWEK